MVTRRRHCHCDQCCCTGDAAALTGYICHLMYAGYSDRTHHCDYDERSVYAQVEQTRLVHWNRANANLRSILYLHRRSRHVIVDGDAEPPVTGYTLFTKRNGHSIDEDLTGQPT